MNRRGFTLLEVLVALAVLALAAAIAAGGLDLLGRALARERRSVEEMRALALAHERLRLELARALPLDWGPPQQPRLAFLGEPERIRLVNASAPWAPEPGLRLVELALEDHREGKILVLRQAGLRRDGSGFAPLAEAEAVTLATVEAGSSFAYFGERPGERGARWWPDWPAAPLLPTAVRLAANGAEAGIVVRLVIDTPLGCLGRRGQGSAACR